MSVNRKSSGQFFGGQSYADNCRQIISGQQLSRRRIVQTKNCPGEEWPTGRFVNANNCPRREFSPRKIVHMKNNRTILCPKLSRRKIVCKFFGDTSLPTIADKLFVANNCPVGGKLSKRRIVQTRNCSGKEWPTRKFVNSNNFPREELSTRQFFINRKSNFMELNNPVAVNFVFISNLEIFTGKKKQLIFNNKSSKTNFIANRLKNPVFKPQNVDKEDLEIEIS